MEVKLKEYEAKQERDKVDSEAKLKEFEVKFESKLNKLFSYAIQQQQTSTHSVTNIEMPEASNVHFLKP